MTGRSPIEFLRALAVDDALLTRLAAMPFSATGTRRICLHESEASPLHAMVVESETGNNFPSHYHADSDEVTIAVKGRLEVLVWDKGATVTPVRIILGDPADGIKIAFIPKGTAHLTKAIGGNCVYLEVKLGPFKKDALVWMDAASLTGTGDGSIVADP